MAFTRFHPIYDRLILGTANWGPEPYRGVRVSRAEQDKIIERAEHYGIHRIEVATAYGTQDLRVPGWSHVVKFHSLQALAGLHIEPHDPTVPSPIACMMAHGDKALPVLWGQERQNDNWLEGWCWGASIYPEDVYDLGGPTCNWITRTDHAWLEYPLNVLDPRMAIFTRHLLSVDHPARPRILARSVFCGGKALEYYTPQQCLQYVLAYPGITYAVLGFDNADQLDEAVGWIDELESHATDDPKVIDPRYWETTP